ncbi:disease resistance protein RPV1-like [Pyrus communis]|uniref:disease resistance protein RPV1-like n=1 Tax=Pyrus communis TaxID=23211 RepID=UPI0035BEBC86
MAVSSFSSVSDDLRWKYDVFVSFRGEDTGRGFVSHLLRAFKQKSISTSVDAEDICRGDCLSEELRKRVQRSRLSIVVFSKNYASSRWCLRELVQMVEQVKMTGQVLVPVFHGVDPSDVRKARGAFCAAFARYDCEMEQEEVRTWRGALAAATDRFGWNIQDYRDDAELIEEIVQFVFNKLIGLSSFEGGWKYDVFLNFRGEDTRKSFSSHLYKALYQKRINTFMDDEELRKGNSLSELLKCIKQSRVSIVVFSEDYASSTWCLKELVQILKCMDEQNQIVIPVFYEVDPSQVCKPEAFTKHDRDSKVEKEEVQSWMSALTRATNLTLPRWDSRNYE